MLTKLKFAFCIIILYLPVQFIKPQDSVKTYSLPPVEIIAKKEINLFDSFNYSTDYNSDLFNKNGFATIRRGTNFTQDLYSEGFKRGDIKLVIDGEQYHTACPNRMDALATRINPLEMHSIDLSKSSALLNTGVYGKVEYHRTKMTENFGIKSYLTGNAGSQNDYDFAANLEGYNTGLLLRIAGGQPYENAEGKKYTELYGYKDNYNYIFGSAGFRHLTGNLQLGATFTLSEKISFPYLMMDEINSKVINAYLSFKGNKAYINYTDHLMNNNLRNSAMFMETDAKNITAGLTGSFYEVVYRHWNADNRIKNQMMNVNIENKLMPNVNQLGGSLANTFRFDVFSLAAKVGAQYIFIGDDYQLDFYRALYSNSKDSRFFLSAGLNLSYSGQLMNELTFLISAEGGAEPPEAEQLYIAVKRPMTNPDWSGNPTLDQPVKTSLRTAFDYKYFHLEGYANYVFNYVNTVKSSGMKNYLTYNNINAALLGINFSASFNYFESHISYLYGENITAGSPLSEITPLTVTSKLLLPEFMNIDIWLTHRYENAQKRIDAELNELVSSAWNTIGLGIGYSYSNLRFDFEVENLLNHNYSRHLSYTRSPFSSGTKVFDPGRSFRLTIYYNNI